MGVGVVQAGNRLVDVKMYDVFRKRQEQTCWWDGGMLGREAIDEVGR